MALREHSSFEPDPIPVDVLPLLDNNQILDSGRYAVKTTPFLCALNLLNANSHHFDFPENEEIKKYYGRACEDYFATVLEGLCDDRVISGYRYSEAYSKLDQKKIDFMVMYPFRRFAKFQIKASAFIAYTKGSELFKRGILSVPIFDFENELLPPLFLCECVANWLDDHNKGYHFLWKSLHSHDYVAENPTAF